MKIELTQKGKEMLLRALGNEITIKLVKMALGNGRYEDTIGDTMQNTVYTLDFASVERKDEYMELRCDFSNADSESRFCLSEIGILATDPDGDGEETVVFAYGYTPEQKAAALPAEDIYTNTIIVSVYVGSVDRIEVSYKELAYVSQQEFENHTDNTANPHNVTKNDVGLDKVENVAFGDHTPIYAIPEKLEPLTPGERFILTLGKLGRAVSDFINHLGSDKNPHKVTAQQSGAAEKEHKHSASDMTSGILGIQRGGTGVDTLPKLKKLLGFADMEIVTGTYTGNGKSGAKNPCRLTFNGKKPLVVFVSGKSNSKAPNGEYYMTCTIILGYGSTQERGGFTPTGEEGLSLTMTWGNDYVEWYAIGEDSVNATRCVSQKSEAGIVYTYTAICFKEEKEG